MTKPIAIKTPKVQHGNHTIAIPRKLIATLERGMQRTDFIRLSNGEKEQLRALFRRTFQPKLSEMNQDMWLTYPFNEIVMVQKLLAASKQLIAQHPTGKVISLGRTPLWLVTMSKILECESDRYEYIAFSGRWEEEAKGPNQEQLEAYRDYLKTISLDPKSIASDNEKTTIVEFADSAQSLWSFINTYRTIAASQCVSESDLQTNLRLHLLEPVHRDRELPFETTYQHIDTDLLNAMFNTDNFGATMGVRFPFDKWTEVIPSPLGSNISINSALVRFHLMDYLFPHVHATNL